MKSKTKQWILIIIMFSGVITQLGTCKKSEGFGMSTLPSVMYTFDNPATKWLLGVKIADHTRTERDNGICMIPGAIIYNTPVWAQTIGFSPKLTNMGENLFDPYNKYHRSYEYILWWSIRFIIKLAWFFIPFYLWFKNPINQKEQI